MTQDVDKGRIANATTKAKIEITEEMIEAVLRVLYEHALPTLTRQAESPELAEALCRAVIAAYQPLSGAARENRQ